MSKDKIGQIRFLPIILGTDANAYGMARAIHQEYGISSICLGKAPLSFTSNSRIVTRILDERMGEDEVLIAHLEKLAAAYPKLPKIIIPCGDGYSAQLSRNREYLAEKFLFNIVPESLQQRLEDKIAFYRTCEEYGLPYPATTVITQADVAGGSVHVPFDYPIALKANDSIEYVGLHFEGKKKAYIISDQDELDRVLSSVYAAGYTGVMVAQDFIPGDCSEMVVLNAYVGRDHKVRMMAMGQCVLDAVLPAEIGNYHALYTADGSAIYQRYRAFLEAVGYSGFANFDLKRDPRDGEYKVFEINLRQGRSSFHMELGECHYLKFLIEDLLKDSAVENTASAGKEPYFHTTEGKLWLYVDPWVVRKYVPKSIKHKALQALARGHGYTWWYSKDRSFRRWVWHMRMRISSIKSYMKYASK